MKCEIKQKFVFYFILLSLLLVTPDWGEEELQWLGEESACVPNNKYKILYVSAVIA